MSDATTSDDETKAILARIEALEDAAIDHKKVIEEIVGLLHGHSCELSDLLKLTKTKRDK